MTRNTFTGRVSLHAMLVGLAFFWCSPSQGEDFVKYTDPGIVTYQIPATMPVHLDNSQIEQVKYFKSNNESDPIRVTPLRRGDTASETAEKLGPMDADFKMAVTNEALDKFINSYAPDELAFVAVQKIAQPFIDGRNWASANEIFTKYRDKFPAKSAAFSEISSILTATEQGVVINNLGLGVNSAEGEYAPVISSNGKKLLFARDCGTCGGGEEIYVAALNKSGNWGEVEKFGPPLSSQKNEIPLALTADGNTLAVYGNYEGSLGRGDIFHIDKTADAWTPLQHYPAPLNSEYFDSDASYSADGKAILFVSDRSGGTGEFHPKGSFYHGDYNGNTDIYAFIPDGSGGGQTINLGPTINTPYAERSPFLHPDGKTLYFSSNGRGGLGGLDLFKSTKLKADSWTDWSEPVNLGKEINTTYDDWGYQFAASGDKGYFSVSNRPDGYGGSDIFSVGLPNKSRPSAVITVGGTVTDPAGNFLAADIRWNDMAIAKEVGHLTSDPKTGEYLIHLPVGGNYTYYAEKSGYMGESESLNLSDELGYKEFIMDIVLHPISAASNQQQKPELVAVLRMNNIFFDFDKSRLRAESTLELDRWIKMLQENPSVTVEIDGHTDSIGDDSYNQKLSELRAKSVVKYLSDHGIDLERLDARGFGEKKPSSSNKTKEGRQLNRRVEVLIFNESGL